MTRSWISQLAARGLCLCLCSLSHAQTADLPPHFEQVCLGTGFDVPVDFEFAPDGSIFLLEKQGRVQVRHNGVWQGTPFLDLADEVLNEHDRGLLSIALAPGFQPDTASRSTEAAWVWLLYTVSPTPGLDPAYNENNQYAFSRLVRYRAVEQDGLWLADPATREVLLGNQNADGTVPDGIASLHNSHSNGSMLFADDGSLLLALGDGAHYDLTDPGGKDKAGFDNYVHPSLGTKGPTPKNQDSGSFRSQDMDSLAGKVLRIEPATGLGYTSNPFYNGDRASNASRVWALGLRNPFRLTALPGTGALDPALGQVNTLLIGDVGWSQWEELNRCTGGENFGWPCSEGFLPQGDYQATNLPHQPITCSDPAVGIPTLPLAAWNHWDASAFQPQGVTFDLDGAPTSGFLGSCSIGGAVYSGSSYAQPYQGLYFFADYASQWLRTASIDASGQLLEIRDFAQGLGPVVALQTNPVNGNLCWLAISGPEQLRELRYVDNLSPQADLRATPTFGPAPLLVDFDASGSADPELDSLSFAWDFGDGMQLTGSARVQHSYAGEGHYLAKVTVSDSPGGQDSAQLDIFVGNTQPTIELLEPLQGSTFEAPTNLPLSGLAYDAEDGPLPVHWEVTLIHDGHEHPSTFVSDLAQDTLIVDAHGLSSELVYYRITLSATDSSGFSSAQHVFVYPEHSVRDVSGDSRPITRVEELLPPLAQGLGEIDPEIVRDGVSPPPGTLAPSLQFDSFHFGAQGEDDWIGLELQFPPAYPYERFIGLDFQEGLHASNGGWFENLHVEVRDQGQWTTAQNLVLTPAYPFAYSGQPFFDGVGFETYQLRFDPLPGDAVRLRGKPGGSAQFLSCAELRALRVLPEGPAPAFQTITDQGTAIARIFEFFPPVPFGAGSPSVETMRNGSFGSFGSQSSFAQWDSYWFGLQGDLDWVGWSFPEPQTLARVLFQEGLHYLGGGYLDDLRVEVQTAVGGPWQAVVNLAVDPPYPGLSTAADGGYERFTLDFEPVLARALRIAGNPAEPGNFLSVGELAVFAPALPENCGLEPYGLSSESVQSLSAEGELPAAVGLPYRLQVSGAPAFAPGWLALAGNAAQLPLLGGTLLVDPFSLQLIGLLFAGDGSLEISGALGSDPGQVGIVMYLQFAALDPSKPEGVALSNGLRWTLCAW